MAYKYSMEADKEKTARAVGVSLPISRKQGIEISNYIRKKTVARAKKLLEDTISMKAPIPFKRFTSGAGHRKGIESGPGKYPISACTEILSIVKLAESNAQFKGLNTDSLVIKHISTQQAASSYKQSRHRGRKAKRAHVEVIVEETEKSKPKAKKTAEKPEAKKETKAPEAKVEEKKVAEKKTEAVDDAKAKASKEAVKNIETPNQKSVTAETEQKQEEKEKAAMPKEQKNELK